MKKIINYLRPIWEGNDGKPSIRRILALVFAAGLIHLSILHITSCQTVQEAFIWGFISLIVALLGLTTFQNLKELNGSNINKENTTNTSETEGKLD